MYFTDCNLDNDNNKCYYRRAFEPAKFASLTEDEKKRLIVFTVNLLDPYALVKFSDNLFEHQIGNYDADTTTIYINSRLLQSPDNSLFSYELFSYLYRMVFVNAYKSARRNTQNKGRIYIKIKKKYENEKINSIEKLSYYALLDELYLMNRYYEIVLLHNNLKDYIEQIFTQCSVQEQSKIDEDVNVNLIQPSREMGRRK